MGDQPSGYPCLVPTHGCPLPSIPDAGGEPSPAQLTQILIVPSHTASHSTASPGPVVLCWGAQGCKASPIRSDPLEETASTCHPQAAGAHPARHWPHRAFPRGCAGTMASRPASGRCCASLWEHGTSFGASLLVNPPSSAPTHLSIHPSQEKTAQAPTLSFGWCLNPAAAHHPTAGHGGRGVVPDLRNPAQSGDQPDLSP